MYGNVLIMIYTDKKAAVAVGRTGRGSAVFKRSKCVFRFGEIHGLRNLTREPALASALDEVSR